MILDHGDWQAEYAALTAGAALLDLSERQQLRVTGRDRATWLQGQVTQDVLGGPPGRILPATVLTPQGRMVAECRIRVLPEEIWVDFPAGTASPMVEYLDRFLIMERAELEDLSPERRLFSVQGPRAALALESLLDHELPAPGEFRRVEMAGFDVDLARVTHCGEDGFDLFLPQEAGNAAWELLRSAGAQPCGFTALETRRLEAGIPRWGAELDPTIVPLEARLDHTISLTKGCYIGQEIIARIDARGHVNNLLAGFFLPEDVGSLAGAEVFHQGRRVGKVVSETRSPTLGRPIGLGYLRRELQDPGEQYEAVPRGTESETPSRDHQLGEPAITVTVTNLPFIPSTFG